VKRSRLQSQLAPSRIHLPLDGVAVCAFHSHTRSSKLSRPWCGGPGPLRPVCAPPPSEWRSRRGRKPGMPQGVIALHAMPRTVTSISVCSTCGRLCNDPVTLGGGMTSENYALAGLAGGAEDAESIPPLRQCGSKTAEARTLCRFAWGEFHIASGGACFSLPTRAMRALRFGGTSAAELPGTRNPSPLPAGDCRPVASRRHFDESGPAKWARRRARSKRRRKRCPTLDRVSGRRRQQPQRCDGHHFASILGLTFWDAEGLDCRPSVFMSETYPLRDGREATVALDG